MGRIADTVAGGLPDPPTRPNKLDRSHRHPERHNYGCGMNREPALIIGLVQALIALAVSFGLGLTPEQIGAVLAVTAAGLAVWTRSRVVPAAQVEPNPEYPERHEFA
jgi:hypothetical protein